ncbi:MAG: superoxide dismutase [Pseudomonadota bacterium]|nr:superoxide dismutase [Pseudomonadota bacterium]
MSELRPSRRDLLAGTLAGAAVSVLATRSFSALAADPAPPAPVPVAPAGPLILLPLPYADTALAPVISQNTLSFHYGKHHKAYVDNGNKALAGSTLFARQSIPEILRATQGKPELAAVYNNVAQAWNHQFYWQSMRPGGGGAPSGRMGDKIKSDLGGYDAFKAIFSKAATGRFGSGWAWLVSNKGKLEVMDTPNADNPLTLGLTPLVVIDVWEHAYYLDFQNRRADYVTAWLEKLVNWEFADANLG